MISARLALAATLYLALAASLGYGNLQSFWLAAEQQVAETLEDLSEFDGLPDVHPAGRQLRCNDQSRTAAAPRPTAITACRQASIGCTLSPMSHTATPPAESGACAKLRC